MALQANEFFEENNKKNRRYSNIRPWPFKPGNRVNEIIRHEQDGYDIKKEKFQNVPLIILKNFYF